MWKDAKALYEQVTEKQKSITDMNAYYDYQIHLSGSALEGIEDAGNMRMEMNVRIEPFNRYGKSCSTAVTAVLPCRDRNQWSALCIYKDGTSYMDAGGMKIKYPMDLSKMAEQISSQTFLLASGQESGRTADGFPFMDRRG